MKIPLLGDKRKSSWVPCISNINIIQYKSNNISHVKLFQHDIFTGLRQK